MSDAEDATSSPGPSGLSSRGLSLPAGRGLPVTALSLSSPGRLTSLRTRDFTLGGAFKKPKKTFEPNVHAVRKSKDELQEKISVAPRKERKERNERKGVRENRGKRRERPKIIQSHSIFEQGPADSLCKRGWRGAKDPCDSTPSPVCKLVKKESKPSEEDEDEILSKLQRDDFIDDPDLRNDAHQKPIQLPLCQSSSFTATPPENPPLLRPQEDRGSHCRSEVPKEALPPLVELLRDLQLSGREEFFFMQLPDCMPAKASDQKTAPPPVRPGAQKGARKEGRPADKIPTPLQASQDLTKEGCPVLSQLPEGFLGKLQIRKSGKVELKMGDVVMDVSEGAAFSFLQQLVSMHLSDAKTGDMMVLGNVHQKLVLSPDFHNLLSHTSTEQQTEPR